MSQQSKSKMSNEDEDIFDFVLDDMSVNTTHRNFDLTGKFHIGDITCTHLLIKTPNGEDVKMLRKKAIDPDSSDEFEDAKSFVDGDNSVPKGWKMSTHKEEDGRTSIMCPQVFSV